MTIDHAARLRENVALLQETVAKYGGSATEYVVTLNLVHDNGMRPDALHLADIVAVLGEPTEAEAAPYVLSDKVLAEIRSRVTGTCSCCGENVHDFDTADVLELLDEVDRLRGVPVDETAGA